MFMCTDLLLTRSDNYVVMYYQRKLIWLSIIKNVIIFYCIYYFNENWYINIYKGFLVLYRLLIEQSLRLIGYRWVRLNKKKIIK